MTLRYKGYTFNEMFVAAVEEIVLAIAPGASAVSSINGQTGAIVLKTVNNIDLIGPGNIDTGLSMGGSGGVATPWSLSVLYDLEYRYYTTTRLTTTNEAYVQNVTGAIPYGRTTWAVQLDGIHLPDFTGLGIPVGTVTLVQESGRVYEITTWRTVAGVYYQLTKGALGAIVDTIPPTILSAAVSDATPTRITIAWSEAMSATISAASAFAVSAGHTLFNHTIIDPTHTFLTVNEPFVQGEGVFLSYTQPVSNKMQDLAGNLLANFSGVTIADTVTTPTLLSASVVLTSPTLVVLSWSEPMGASISAASAFATATHPYTVHTVVDSTHTQLTTSVAFVNGETPVLAYVPPAINKMMDAAGSNLVLTFSGFSIGLSGATGGAPGLDFSDPNNSQYLALISVGGM